MDVCHSRHRVQLEVLVGTDGRSLLNWSPVRVAGLRIVEPLVGELTDVGSVQVRDALGDLRSGDAAASLEDLTADLGVLLSGTGLAHEAVPEVVAGADDLDLSDEVGVEDGGGHAGPVHLADEDLVAEEVTAEDGAVRVGVVAAHLASHIGQVSQEGVSSIVLLLAVIEMLSVLLDVVVTDHVLQKLEGVVVLVVDGWSVEEDTNVGVVHLIITHHEKSGHVDALVVVSRGGGLLLDAAEGLLNLANESVVVDGTSTDDDHVFAEVVSSTVGGEHIGSEVLEVIGVTTLWLSHHVVTEGVEMASLNRSLLHVLV